MNKTSTLPQNLIVFGLPLLIIGSMVILSKLPAFAANPDSLSIGITFDLLITAPFVYFLLIRKTSIPKTTVIPFLILGMLTCSLILPAENQYYLEIFRTYGLPVIELGVVIFIISKVSQGIKEFRLNKKESEDFFTVLKSTCKKFLPGIAMTAFVTEIAVFYYGFLNWKKRKLKDNEFSYHKESGTISLLYALLFIIAIETVVIHILLERWSSTAAWILTFLSIYSGIQLFGFLRSMAKRPIIIENGKLYLRYGIMNQTTIDLENIESIEVTSRDFEINEGSRKLSFLGDLESHNMVIHLKEECSLTGLYGKKRNYRNLALFVDNKSEFKSLLEKAIQKSSLTN